MKRSHLCDYFAGIGVKRLSTEDAEPRTSNQHEIDTTHQMRQHFLGSGDNERFKTTYIWLCEDQPSDVDEGWATHHDARMVQPDRSPGWRLCYPANRVTEVMREGDILFLAMTTQRTLYFIVSPDGSTSYRQLSWLFGVSADASSPESASFVSREFKKDERRLDFAARIVLSALGIEFEGPCPNGFDRIADSLGSKFPRTSVLAQLVRDNLPDVKVNHDMDGALVEWLDCEEALFRRLERRVVSERLHQHQGFLSADGEADVDSFLSFSLSIWNRRESRMGHALEHHLEAVFQAHNISYARGFEAEHQHHPDFLFPDGEAYRAAPQSDGPSLMMVAAKSSCGARWRQVPPEASKIRRKHLLTIEPGISEPLTHQMRETGLQLVVPRPIQDTYTTDQRKWLWTLADFVREVSKRAQL